MTVEAREDPSSTLSAVVVPSGAVMTITPSAPTFANTPSRSMATVSGWPGPATAQGCSRAASVSAAASRKSPNGEDGAAVALEHVEDAPLQRMLGVEVAVEGPVVGHAGQEHRRVLARAIHVDPLPRAAGADQLLTCELVARRRRRASQHRGGQRGSCEEAPHERDVRRRAGVARRRDRRVLTAQRDARGHDGDRLERLHARPREDRSPRVPEVTQHVALGGEHHGGAGVPGLDETTSLDHSEFDGVGDGERAGHRIIRARRDRRPARGVRLRSGRR